MAHVQRALDRAKLADNVKKLKKILAMILAPTFYHSSVRWLKSTSPDGKEFGSIRDDYTNFAVLIREVMKLDVDQLGRVFEAFEKDIDKKNPSKIFE